MRQLILLFLLFAYSLNSDDIRASILEKFMDKSPHELFKVFHYVYHKKYELNSEEGVKRYQIFSNNLKNIKEVNALNLSYELGIHEFSDLSIEDFPKNPLKSIHSFSNTLRSTDYKFQQNDLADYSSALLTPRKWGACFESGQLAVATSASYFYFKKTGLKEYFSTQAVSDCYLDPRIVDETYNECFALSAWSTFTPMHDNKLPLEKDYPTKNSKSKFKCQKEVINNDKVVGLKLQQYQHCIDCDYKLWVELFKLGPVHTTDLCWANEIYSYKKGILRLNEKSCSENGGFWDSVVVGLGYDEKEKTFYVKIQSPLGPTWGEKGFMRLAVDPNASDKINGKVFNGAALMIFE